MKLKSLENLFIHELRDIYSAETQLIKALPKMAEAATNAELKAGFEAHLKQTETHLSRLEKIFKGLNKSPNGDTCEGMKGLIKEGAKMIEEDAEDAVRDAGLISAAQRVEHYEIAAYGTVISFAETLGHEDACDILAQTLDEEEATDEKLSALAEGTINVEAAELELAED